MTKAKTPSFVLELPLQTTFNDDRVMWSRMESGRRIFNAVLGESLKRLNRLRESEEWSLASEIKNQKEKNKAYGQAHKKYLFTEYALHDLAGLIRKSGGFSDRIGSHETQKIATRVWSALEEYRFGIRGKPRFKGFKRPIHSLEGKTNKACIRFKKETSTLHWGKLSLRIKTPDTPYVCEALSNKTKFCRIVWRNIKGRRRWFVQLVQSGEAPNRYEFLATGAEVGLDIGPSTIAIVSEIGTGLERFAPSVEQPWDLIKKIQRKMARSQRATNPDNFNENGTVKKGARQWVKSSRYLLLESQLRELERNLASRRKSDHGKLANKVMGLGTIIKTEKLSYIGLQKNYGRSVKQRAPSAFIDLLNRKAERAGGKLIQLNTWALKMSQFDHTNGLYKKKPLSQRHHVLDDKTSVVQRDSYSAFLALNAEGNTHNLSQLKSSWATVEPLLRRARLCVDELASGKVLAFPTVKIPSELIARQRVLG